MEVSDLLTMTPEQRAKRKEEYDERMALIRAGQDADRLKAQERALKALFLLKEHVNGNRVLSEPERVALAGIVVERCIDSFFFFAKHVLEMDLLTEQTHKKWADDLQSALYRGKKRMMRLKPRGCYKTTLYGLANMLWLWGCVSPQIRVFYTSANSLLLQEVSDKLNQYIGTEKSETLYSLIFGITKDPVAKNTSDVFNIKGRSGKGFSLVFRTSGGSSVGIHPNICIVDDPCDQNDRDSDTTRQGKARWFDGLTPLLVPFFDPKTGISLETILYIGTHWHLRDLIWHIEETNKKLPEDSKWDIESESVFTEDRQARYPEFFPLSKIMEIKANISDVFFACQYENLPMSEGMQVFDLKKLFFTRKDQIEIDKGEMLCVFDPSLGKTHSDYAAVWWLHFHNNKITIIDAIDDKVELNLIVHQIANKNMEYGCRHMIYENNGISLVEESLRSAHNRLNWRIHIEGLHHSSNKDERIMSMQPALYSGQVQFMSDYEIRYPEAMAQLIFYPVYGHDDFPDCLQMGIEHFKQARFQFIRYEELL